MFSLLFSSNQVFANVNKGMDPFFTMAMCTDGNKICAIGKQIMRTNDPQGLYVAGGVVCTPDRTICTNGFYTLRSTKPIF